MFSSLVYRFRAMCHNKISRMSWNFLKATFREKWYWKICYTLHPHYRVTWCKENLTCRLPDWHLHDLQLHLGTTLHVMTCCLARSPFPLPSEVYPGTDDSRCVRYSSWMQSGLNWADSLVCGPGWHSWYSNLLRAGQDYIPEGAIFSAPVQTGPWVHPASCTMGTGSLSQGESSRGVLLTTHPI